MYFAKCSRENKRIEVEKEGNKMQHDKANPTEES